MKFCFFYFGFFVLVDSSTLYSAEFVFSAVDILKDAVYGFSFLVCCGLLQVFMVFLRYLNFDIFSIFLVPYLFFELFKIVSTSVLVYLFVGEVNLYILDTSLLNSVLSFICVLGLLIFEYCVRFEFVILNFSNYFL